MSRDVFSTRGFKGLANVPDFAAARRVGLGAVVLGFPDDLEAAPLDLSTDFPTRADVVAAPLPAPAREAGDFPAPLRSGEPLPVLSSSFLEGRGLLLMTLLSVEASPFAFEVESIPFPVRVSGISGRALRGSCSGVSVRRCRAERKAG